MSNGSNSSSFCFGDEEVSKLFKFVAVVGPTPDEVENDKMENLDDKLIFRKSRVIVDKCIVM